MTVQTGASTKTPVKTTKAPVEVKGDPVKAAKKAAPAPLPKPSAGTIVAFDASTREKMRKIILAHDAIAIRATGDKAADRKKQQEMQHVGYACGWANNWTTPIKDGFIRGFVKDPTKPKGVVKDPPKPRAKAEAKTETKATTTKAPAKSNGKASGNAVNVASAIAKVAAAPKETAPEVVAPSVDSKEVVNLIRKAIADLGLDSKAGVRVSPRDESWVVEDNSARTLTRHVSQEDAFFAKDVAEGIIKELAVNV